MKCWVCKRQARGYGHADVRSGIGRAERYPMDWVFCSRRCQDAFHALYGVWARVKGGMQDMREVNMIDSSDVERASMRKCLKPFGEAATAIGFDKPLAQYSEAEALQVIDAIVTGYTEAMIEHHEASKFPPVRGLAPTSDPMLNPFADLQDGLDSDQRKGAKR